MKKVETRFDDVTIAKIQATGKSVYQFLQEAVALKLQNDNAININDSLDRRFKEFEKRLEDKLIQSVEASHKILQASIQKDETFKERTLENLKIISSYIKGV